MRHCNPDLQMDLQELHDDFFFGFLAFDELWVHGHVVDVDDILDGYLS